MSKATPKFIFSKAPIDQIPLLGEPLSSAIQTSHTWNMERTYGVPKTECMVAELSKDVTNDISITFRVGPVLGCNMINMFMLEAS